MIIRFDQFLENVHVLERIVRCKVFPHFCLERAIKPFDNRCLGFVVCRKKSNAMFLEKGLKLRAVASMYSWGGVGQKFPNEEENFRIFHGIRSHEGVCYPENEDAIYKQKYT